MRRSSAALAPLQLLLRSLNRSPDRSPDGSPGTQPALPAGLSIADVSSGTAGLGTPQSDRRPSGYLWDEGEDGNDLRVQRWAVLAPQGSVGDRLLSLLAPLIAWRKQQQGDVDVRIYRVPAQLDDAEAAQYRRQHIDTGTELALHLPRYLLLLGDLDQMPLSLQQVLQTDALVGRLAFEDPAGYEAYVEKLLRSERAKKTQGQALLYAVPDGTAATSVGYDSLIAPSIDLMARNPGDVAGRVRNLNDESGDVLERGPLLAVARSPQPTVLLSVSHGEGPPPGGYRSVSEQRQRQGALCFGSDDMLRATELADARFLPGGLWLMVACYGAGTPGHSAYRPFLERIAAQGASRDALSSVLSGLPRRGERPFVAALPQAVLASRDGPLAVIGHMDLAWTYSFSDLDRGAQAVPRPARFVAALRAALRGDRIGLAMRELMRAAGQAQTELLSLQLRAAMATGSVGIDVGAGRMGPLWMLRQDLLGYVLLGDPAARLPVERPAQATQGTQATSAATAAEELGLPSPMLSSARATRTAVATARSSTVRPSGTADVERSSSVERMASLPRPLPVLEAAFGRVLSGQRDVASMASELELPLATFARLLDRFRSAGRAALLQPDAEPSDGT